MLARGQWSSNGWWQIPSVFISQTRFRKNFKIPFDIRSTECIIQESHGNTTLKMILARTGELVDLGASRMRASAENHDEKVAKLASVNAAPKESRKTRIGPDRYRIVGLWTQDDSRFRIAK